MIGINHMKKGTHLLLKDNMFILSDGSTLVRRSATNDQFLFLDTDYRSNPTWNRPSESAYTEVKGQIAKFKRRYK